MAEDVDGNGKNGQAPSPEGEEVTIDNSALIAAMEAVAVGDDPTTREQLYRAMLASHFLLAVAEAPTEDGNLNVLMLQRDDGTPVLPVFTGDQPLTAWKSDGANFVVMKAKDLFAMVAAQGQGQDIVINPAGPTGGLVAAHEVRVLADGMLPGHDGTAIPLEDMSMQFGMPPGPLPPDLMEALTYELPFHSVVEAAYVFVAVLGNSPARLMLGLSFADSADDAAIQSTFKRLLEVAKDGLGGSDPIDGIPLAGQMLADVREVIPAVYEQTPPA